MPKKCALGQRTHAVICTRSHTFSPMFNKLLLYLGKRDVNTQIVINAESIFKGYEQGISQIHDLSDDDVIILCHDDINILSAEDIFEDMLAKCRIPEVGFVGVAGAKNLLPGAMWGGTSHRSEGSCGGICFRGNSYKNFGIVIFGHFGRVFILDGLFLAIQWKKLKRIDMSCPNYLSGGWHIYDLYYTKQIHDLGYENHTFPIFILHDDKDNTFSDDWNQARTAFAIHNGLVFNLEMSAQ